MSGEDQDAKQPDREVTAQVNRLCANADALSKVAERLYEKVAPLLNESAQGDSSGEVEKGKDDAVCPLAAEIRLHNDSIAGSKGKINSIVNRIEIN